MTLPKILVVEDESITAMDIAETLADLNYDVVDVVDTGELAIASAHEYKPDLILMDIVLQGDMTGIEAAAIIQKDLQIPIIYLTAYTDPKTLEQARNTEPFGYILKPIKSADLQSTLMMALARHNANKRQLQQALDQQVEYLKHLRGRYVSMVSHELRQPLTQVSSSAELLSLYGDNLSDAERDQCLLFIQQAVSNMTDLVKDLSFFSRSESGTFECNLHWMDVSAFCHELEVELRFNLSPSLTLDFLYPPTPIYGNLDPRLLRHILVNLISNAIKYSVTGGSVTVILSQTESDLIFEVIDQGIGIPVKDQERLFEMFHRANNVGTVVGTGLGLAIVKNCVELLAGKIKFYSVEGQGSTFMVSLPKGSAETSLNDLS
ncbi:MAG: ATP-binding protein [Pseudanabaena sp. ELA607]